MKYTNKYGAQQKILSDGMSGHSVAENKIIQALCRRREIGWMQKQKEIA